MAERRRAVGGGRMCVSVREREREGGRGGRTRMLAMRERTKCEPFFSQRLIFVLPFFRSAPSFLPNLSPDLSNFP